MRPQLVKHGPWAGGWPGKIGGAVLGDRARDGAPILHIPPCWRIGWLTARMVLVVLVVVVVLV